MSSDLSRIREYILDAILCLCLSRSKISTTEGHKRHTPDQIEKIRAYNSSREITDDMRKKWSATRLGNTPTKVEYPPIDELLKLIDETNRSQVAKTLGVAFSSLNKYLKRRGVEF